MYESAVQFDFSENFLFKFIFSIINDRKNLRALINDYVFLFQPTELSCTNDKITYQNLSVQIDGLLMLIRCAGQTH